MDWRERNYYLATINYCTRDMRIEYYKLVAPSLKIHTPYHHIKNGRDRDNVEGRYWEMMLSCRKEDSDCLEYELRKAERRDEIYYPGSFGSHFLKLNKELCGQ